VLQRGGCRGEGNWRRWGRAGASGTTGAPTAEQQLAVVDSVQAMITPLGYYEAYELVVLVSQRLGDTEKVPRARDAGRGTGMNGSCARGIRV